MEMLCLAAMQKGKAEAPRLVVEPCSSQTHVASRRSIEGRCVLYVNFTCVAGDCTATRWRLSVLRSMPAAAGRNLCALPALSACLLQLGHIVGTSATPSKTPKFKLRGSASAQCTPYVLSLIK